MRLKPLLAIACALLVAACQTVQPTNQAAVDYNRAFARARDEITLLNVLRASERQPLQFSTIASVQGAMRSGASLRVPFINLIGGAANAISPEVTLSARNPTVSIAPLATREFIQGVSRPLSPGVIDDLLVQGWPLDVVLGLTVGGVVCADGTARLNFGDDPEKDARFLTSFRQVRDFGFELGATTPFAELRMPAAEALRALRDGAGSGRRVVSVTPVPGSGEALVRLVTPGQGRIKGIDVSEICGSGGESPRRPADEDVVKSAERQGGVLLRSVFGIFHYLGKAQAAALADHLERCRGGQPADAVQPALFRIAVACPGRSGPTRPAVSTEFHGRRFALRRAGDAPPGDRTLETLSLLTYLVDLQTSETAVKASVPFIAITQP